MTQAITGFIPEMEGTTRIRVLGTGKTISGNRTIKQTYKITEVLPDGHAMISLIDDNRTMKLSTRVMTPKKMSLSEFFKLCP